MRSKYDLIFLFLARKKYIIIEELKKSNIILFRRKVKWKIRLRRKLKRRKRWNA